MLRCDGSGGRARSLWHDSKQLKIGDVRSSPGCCRIQSAAASMRGGVEVIRATREDRPPLLPLVWSPPRIVRPTRPLSVSCSLQCKPALRGHCLQLRLFVIVVTMARP